MTRANRMSSASDSLKWSWFLLASVVALIVASLMLSGCGWLFGKQKKPMTVNVEVTAGDSLNWDGVRAQAVRLKVYCLKDGANFMNGDTRVFFGDWDIEWREMVFHKRDTLALRTIDLGPGETRTTKMVIPHGTAKREKPVFAVIADFLRPPTDKSERLSFELKKKWDQTIKITVGKDWVARNGKKK